MQTDPEAAGMNPRQLARIRAHLETRYLEPGKVAGFLPLVWRRGHPAWCQPLGMMDRERERPMREDTIFRIYSMTKPVTSVALMTLYEEGHFQLNDPVRRFIPELADLRVFRSGNYPDFLTRPAERPVTIRHLLTHTAGLTYDFMQHSNVDRAYRRLGVRPEPAGDAREMIRRLAGLPLEFTPGTRWNYSFATDVAGHLVERISGQSLETFLRRRIFGPLAMDDTGFTVPPESVGRFAANYERGPDKRLRLIDDPQDSPYIRDKTFFSGGGGLVSTAGDYLRFCRMLLGGGSLEGVRILGRRTLDLMTRNHLPGGADIPAIGLDTVVERNMDGYGFGLGFSVNLGPERTGTIGSAGEYAWSGAASTLFWVDPAEDLVCILMTQLMPSGTFNFRDQLKALVYPAIE
ncbi:MAG TPA: serine hydrolase domain-containing protein [Gammaproteobacteria bacterium]|nr:serine hydrolase domain-containing protein [Gammaproteobacteria bacterium]